MWYDYLAWFVAGLFLVNAVPHFVQGVSGSKFQSPFGKPPGVGESSPASNVLWGSANAVVGYLLLYGVGAFRWGINLGALCLGAGTVVAGVWLARYFGNVRSS